MKTSAAKTKNNCSKKLKKTLKNWKISQVCGLKSCVLLKCQDSPMWSSDSMQALSKSQDLCNINWKTGPQIRVEFLGAPNSQNGLEKRTSLNKLKLKTFKTYYMVIAI